MATEKITQARLNNWLTDTRKKNDSLNCAEIGGFNVRVNQDSPKGEPAPASYRIKYRVNGAQRTPTISKVGVITLANARKQAGIFKAQAKTGKDILHERKLAQQAEKDRKTKEASKLPTLQSWFDQCYHDHLFENGKTSRITYYKRWLAILGHKSLDQISVEDVANSLRVYGPAVRKENSDRKNMEYFKEIASAYATDNNCINPLGNSKWSSYVKIAKLSWKDDECDNRTAIDREDFVKIIDSLERLCLKYPKNASPLAVLFMAYTGMRPADIVSIQWKHVNTKNSSFYHIRKKISKSKAYTSIPISPEAVKILERARKISGGNYVFSESPKAKGVANLGSVWWKKVRDETGIKFVLYQLRHNIAHQIINNNGSITQVAATLGNTVEICVRNYLHSDPKHAALLLTKIDYFKST